LPKLLQSKNEKSKKNFACWQIFNRLSVDGNNLEKHISCGIEPVICSCVIKGNPFPDAVLMPSKQTSHNINLISESFPPAEGSFESYTFLIKYSFTNPEPRQIILLAFLLLIDEHHSSFVNLHFN